MSEPLPRDDGAAADVRRPWLPGCLASRHLTVDDVVSLSYVVVDEMVGDHVGLTVTPWPAADGLGRLRFVDRDASFELAVSRDRLLVELYKVLRLKRMPRVGDVFAARLSARGRQLLERGEDVHWRGPLRDLVEGVVYDVSQEARKVAKLALYAMAAPEPTPRRRPGPRPTSTSPSSIGARMPPCSRNSARPEDVTTCAATSSSCPTTLPSTG